MEADLQPSAALGDLLRLLRALANGRMPEAPPADWEAVWRVAHAHGVDDFAYPRLRQWPESVRPPAALLAQWRVRFLDAVAAATRRQQQIEALLAALPAAGVPVMPLKGAWLAAHVYDDTACRPMVDIDLLVPRTAVPVAERVLRGMGYTGGGAIAAERYVREQTYRHPSGGLPVELHWRFVYDVFPGTPEPDIEALWQVSGGQAPACVRHLPPADHLMLLAHHALHHRLGLPLRGWLDFVLLGRHLAAGAAAPVRLAELQAAAARWHLGRAASAMLGVAAELLDAAWPPPLDLWATDEAESGRRKEAVALALAWGEEAHPAAAATLATLQARHGLARAGLLLRRIGMPRDFMRQRYRCARCAAGLPWAYLRRAWELASAHAGDVGRVLRGEKQTGRALQHQAARERLVRGWLAAGSFDSRR